jgi:Zn-dependent protease with chaperone function
MYIYSLSFLFLYLLLERCNLSIIRSFVHCMHSSIQPTNHHNGQRILLEQIVRGYGCEDPSSILIAQEGSVRSNPSEDAYTENSSRLVQLAKISFVGDKIVQSGKSFVDEKIKEIIGKHMKQRQNATGDPVSQDEMEESLSQDVDFMKWTEAKERMENGTTTTATRGEKWKFVLVDSPVPNACVSELVPCTIFVTTSLLNTFTTNDDELALILGHEVVSAVVSIYHDACVCILFLLVGVSEKKRFH